MTRHVKTATICLLCMKPLTPEQDAVWGKVDKGQPGVYKAELFDWFHVECVPQDFVEIVMDEEMMT